MKERLIKIMERLIVPQFESELSGFEEAAEEISKLIEEERVKAFGTMAEIKPFTGEFENFLLVNALRCLTKEQFRDLTLALMARTSLWIPVSERLPEAEKRYPLRRSYEHNHELLVGELVPYLDKGKVCYHWDIDGHDHFEGLGYISEYYDLPPLPEAK